MRIRRWRGRSAALLAIAAVVVFAPSGQAAPASPLQISKTADSAAVNAGDPIGYTITVSNPGTRPVNAFVSDTLPTNAGTAWSITPAVSGCSISSGTLNCAARIAPTGTFSVHISSPTTTATCGTVSNTAFVAAPSSGTSTSPPTTIAVSCTPSFTATLADDGACSFTLTATWSNAQVDHVFGLWYLDGAWVGTTEAPGTGPNAGTISGNTATFQTGPYTPTADVHDWNVLVQFYYQGAFVSQVYSNDVFVSCGIPSP